MVLVTMMIDTVDVNQCSSWLKLSYANGFEVKWSRG